MTISRLVNKLSPVYESPISIFIVRRYPGCTRLWSRWIHASSSRSIL